MNRALPFILLLALSGCASPEEGAEPAPAHQHAGHGDHHDAGGQHSAAKAPAVDPICGMKVDPGTTRIVEEGGQRFLFCSDACHDSFKESPRTKGQAFFDAGCSCAAEMPGCDCGHCSGSFEPCPCG